MLHYDIVSRYFHLLTLLLLPVFEGWCEPGEVEGADVFGCRHVAIGSLRRKREARLLLGRHLEGPMQILLRMHHPTPTTPGLDLFLRKHSRISSLLEQIIPIHVKQQTILQGRQLT